MFNFFNIYFEIVLVFLFYAALPVPLQLCCVVLVWFILYFFRIDWKIKLYIFLFLLKKVLFGLFFLLSFSFLESILTLIFLLIPVAAYSLVDRKLMALVQRRKGPNVVGPLGLLQFLIDGVKLFFKEVIVPSKSSKFWFMVSPILSVCLSLTGWAIIPLHPVLRFPEIPLDLLVLLALSSFNVYTVVLSGWASNSRYAFLGSLRAIAQIISYEIPMFFSIMPLVAYTGSLSLSVIVSYQSNMSFFVPFFPCSVIFLICIIAETNRAPFDLAEAESELVAGFNTEYSSLIFAFFFISEYASMLLMSVLWILLFWGGWLPFFYFSGFASFGFICFGIKLSVISFFFVFVRANLPRYRYDQFMDFGWKVLIPTTLVLFLFYCAVIIFFFYSF